MAFELEGLAAAAGLERAGRKALVYLGAARALREKTGGLSVPAEQAILALAVTVLPAQDRQNALDQGRSQPFSATIAAVMADLRAERPVS